VETWRDLALIPKGGGDLERPGSDRDIKPNQSTLLFISIISYKSNYTRGRRLST